MNWTLEVVAVPVKQGPAAAIAGVNRSAVCPEVLATTLSTMRMKPRYPGR